MFGAAIPFAHTFTNDARAGTIVFGAIGGLALVAGLVGGSSLAWPGAVPAGLVSGLGGAALLAVVLTTWISNAPALKR